MTQKITNNLLFFLSLVGVILTCSCMRDQYDAEARPQYTGETANVKMRLAAGRSVTQDQIHSLRVIVFSGGKLVDNALRGISADNRVEAKAAAGVNNFYFICNETEAMTSQLESITREEDIENIPLQTKDLGEFVPMYGKETEVTVAISTSESGVQVSITKKGESTPTTELDVSVKRMLARLSMTVIKNTSQSPEKFTIEKMSYRICRVPAYTTIKEETPYTEATLWADEITQYGTGTIKTDGNYVKTGDDYQVESGDFITFPDVYLPEHILSAKEDRTRSTFMIVTALCRMEGSSMTMDAVYNVPLGNQPPTDLDLVRNVHYKLYATVKNLGAMGFHAEIVPMTEYDIPVSWKPFEGYDVVDERVSEFGKNKSIWNNYSQYCGILKIVKNKVYTPVLFRYGSVVAVADNASAGAFDVATDLLWKPTITGNVTSWDDIAYLTGGDLQPQHTLENIRAGRGDPCRLVGLTESEITAGTIDNKQWRMPTAREMEWILTARNSESNSNGFYSFHSLLTPVSGYRTADGTMNPASAGGNYWSSTGMEAFSFSTTDNTGSMAVADPAQARTVRCIRQDIPPSRLGLDGVIIPYLGATDRVIPISDRHLAPYWKASLKNPADAGLLTIVKSEGGNEDDLVITMPPAPEAYVSRSFPVIVTGFGLDGKVHQNEKVIQQSSLIHHVVTNLVSPTDLPFVSGYLRIPKQGITLDISMTILPYPLAPYAADFENKKWRAQAYYYTDQANYVEGSEAVYSGTSQITIPENIWGHLVAVEVQMVTSESVYPPYLISKVKKIFFIQEVN